LIRGISAIAVIAVAGLLGGLYCPPARSAAIEDKAENALLAFAKAHGKAGKKSAHKKKKHSDSDEAEDKPRESAPPAELPDVSAADVALVRKAIESLRRSPETATQVEGTISDPAARKLVDWRCACSLRGTTPAFIAGSCAWCATRYSPRISSAKYLLMCGGRPAHSPAGPR